jgi:Rod binding domain-containing protein
MISPVESKAQPHVTLGVMDASARGIRHLPAEHQVAAAAGQFEAILLRQFLQESVGKIMGGQDGGAQGGVYGYFLTDVLASKLADGGGLGLGRVLRQQLSPRTGPGAAKEVS